MHCSKHDLILYAPCISGWDTQISVECCPISTTHLPQPCTASECRPPLSPLQAPPPSQLAYGHQHSEQWRSSGSRHWRVDLKVREVIEMKGALRHRNGEKY
jgi:hypothetical protein